jgi:hypothetical protein
MIRAAAAAVWPDRCPNLLELVQIGSLPDEGDIISIEEIDRRC